MKYFPHNSISENSIIRLDFFHLPKKIKIESIIYLIQGVKLFEFIFSFKNVKNFQATWWMESVKIRHRGDGNSLFCCFNSLLLFKESLIFMRLWCYLNRVSKLCLTIFSRYVYWNLIKREHFVVETHFESNRVDMQINLIKEFDFFILTSSASLSQKWSNFLKKGRTQNWFLIRMQNDNILEREKTDTQSILF